MGKKRVARYRQAFREMSVERMKSSDDITKLAAELGVHRSVLYQWRDQLLAMGKAEGEPQSADAGLRRENELLKRALAEKILEVDFFRNALQKVEARRQRDQTPGETASTSKSGSGCPCKAS